MKQFLFAAGAIASGAVDAISSSNYGKIGFAYLDKEDNKTKFTATGNEIVAAGKGYLVLARGNGDMGNVVIPIHKNHFSYVKGTYDDTLYEFYENGFTVPDVVPYEDYTVIVVLKGKRFNERNKWTATVRSKASDTAATIAQKLADQINANIGANVEATVNGAAVTITAKEKGVDYKIVLADELFGVELDTAADSEVVMKPYGSVKYIKDLAAKAAADAGFEYTFDDGVSLIYPKYPLNVNDQPAQDEEAQGCVIYTLRFAEPRDVKTRDEIVHQLVQVAFPVGEDGDFEAVCEALAGIE